MPEEISTMSQEETAFSDIIGDLVEQWGFRRHLGRIWSLLYLRRKPLSPTELQTELSLSAGSVNTLLAELQTWGVIRRIRVAGDRNFYFEAETQIWKSISNVLRTRECRILTEAVGGLDALAETLGRSSKKEAAQFQLKRLEHVRAAIESASRLASLLVSASPERLEKVSRLIHRLRTL